MPAAYALQHNEEENARWSGGTRSADRQMIGRPTHARNFVEGWEAEPMTRSKPTDTLRRSPLPRALNSQPLWHSGARTPRAIHRRTRRAREIPRRLSPSSKRKPQTTTTKLVAAAGNSQPVNWGSSLTANKECGAYAHTHTQHTREHRGDSCERCRVHKRASRALAAAEIGQATKRMAPAEAMSSAFEGGTQLRVTNDTDTAGRD